MSFILVRLNSSHQFHKRTIISPHNFVIFLGKVVNFQALSSFTRILHIHKQVSPMKFPQKMNINVSTFKNKQSKFVLAWVKGNNFRFCGFCFTVCAFSEKPFGMVSEIKLCIFLKKSIPWNKLSLFKELQFWVRRLVWRKTKKVYV